MHFSFNPTLRNVRSQAVRISRFNFIRDYSLLWLSFLLFGFIPLLLTSCHEEEEGIEVAAIPVEAGEQPTIKQLVKGLLNEGEELILPPGMSLNDFPEIDSSHRDRPDLRWLAEYIQLGGICRPFPGYRPDEHEDDESVLFNDDRGGYTDYRKQIEAWERAQERMEKWIKEQREGAREKCKPPTYWETVGPTEAGGRTYAAMFDPNDPKGHKVWAVASGGGLWKNENVFDAKSSWVQVPEFLEDMKLSDIAFDPRNKQTFYVCAGRDDPYGHGFWRSDNGGLSWKMVAQASKYKALKQAFHMVVHPLNGDIYLSTMENSWLYRSTDKGVTWKLVMEEYVDDIEFDSHGNMYISRWGKGVYRAKNNRPGGRSDFDTLCTESNGFAKWRTYERMEIAVAPTNPKVIYAFVDSIFPEQVRNGKVISPEMNFVPGVFKTVDAGKTWTYKRFPNARNSGERIFSHCDQAWHNFTARVHPKDENVVYLGTTDWIRSSDGGNSWDWFARYYGSKRQHYPFIYADQHNLYFHPNNPDTILFVNDGGVYYTKDGRTQGKAVSMVKANKDFTVTEFYYTSLHPDKEYFIGGAQDLGVHQFTNGSPGKRVYGGDGAFVAIDQDEPENEIHCENYGSCRLARYDKYGARIYRYSLSKPEDVRLINTAGYDSRENIFLNPDHDKRIHRTRYVTSPSNRKTDAIPLPKGNKGGVCVLYASPYSKKGSSTWFIGTRDGGRIYRMSNAHKDKVVFRKLNSKVLESTPLKNRDIWMSDLQAWGSEDTLVACFSGFKGGGIWQTLDGGSKWTKKTGNLPDQPIYNIARNPKNSKEVVIACYFGVFLTQDFTANSVKWEPIVGGWESWNALLFSSRRIVRPYTWAPMEEECLEERLPSWTEKR
ncbi:hypothetical protein KFE98_17315 [bacterium SCSIO 12741]|nr:hypothetical protein KFE98_17315 [bacterium SCSIO 12741]